MTKRIHQPRFGRKKRYASLSRVESKSGPAIVSGVEMPTVLSRMIVPEMSLSKEFKNGMDRMGAVELGPTSGIDRMSAWAEGLLTAANISTDWRYALGAVAGKEATQEWYAAQAVACANKVRELIAAGDACGAAEFSTQLCGCFYHALTQQMTEATLRGVLEIQGGVTSAETGAPTQKREQGEITLGKLKEELKRRGWQPDQRGIAKQLAGVSDLPKSVQHVRRLLASLKPKKTKQAHTLT